MTPTRQTQNVFIAILNTTTALALDSVTYWTKSTDVYFPAYTDKQTDTFLTVVMYPVVTLI